MYKIIESQVFKEKVPVIKLKSDEHDLYLGLVGLLNTGLANFLFKQVCFDRRAGRDPVRDTYYEFASTPVGLTPIPNIYTNKNTKFSKFLSLASAMDVAAHQITSLSLRKVFESNNDGYYLWNKLLDGYAPPHPELVAPFTVAQQLVESRDWAIELCEDIRGRMIFLQEEMDWLVYELYGLIDKAPLAEDYLTPKQYKDARLSLGQRPFEVAGKGYQGDWRPGYQPPPLPAYLQPLTEARIGLIEANPDIALLEDPLYKRRWVPPDYAAEFREAAHWWLAEKLEFALEQYRRPITLKEWARRLGRDERVNATLEVLTGSPTFDIEVELLKVIEANAVPNRPEHYLNLAGLRKLHVEGAEFKNGDFGDSTAWRLRGKLNIPRERFIAYREFDHSRRGVTAPDSGGPWFGWAGWDTVQRAEALAYLLEQASRSGWEVNFRQCGLRASLRESLPHLRDALSADEVIEFEGIAGLCNVPLEIGCYCRPYREGVAAGQPGVPGVNDAVLEIKRPGAREQKEKGNRRGKQKNAEQQLGMFEE